MNCKRCGSPMNMGDQFCKNCGATVNEVNNNIGAEQPVNSSIVASQTNNGWSNSSVQPVQTPKKNNNTAIIIVGVIIAIAIFAAIVTGMLVLGKDKEPTKEPENVVDDGGNSGTVTPTPAASSYTVKSNGFTFKVPDNLIYQTGEDMLILMDEEGTWQVAISSMEGNYSQIVKMKNQVKSNFQSYGYTVENMSEETIGGVKYLLFEISVDGENVLVGYTAANSMYFFGFELYDINNEFNYDSLEEFSPVFKNATYNGESNSIDASLDIDLEQAIEGLSE